VADANVPAPGSSSRRARAVMRGNRSRDTLPELAVRRHVHALGLRYRVGVRPLPAVRRTADLVFTRARVAVFVDGCYWHGCPFHYVPSKTNVTWWANKITRNQERDADTDARLRADGWIPIRVWEHEDAREAAQTVAAAVAAGRLRLGH